MIAALWLAGALAAQAPEAKPQGESQGKVDPARQRERIAAEAERWLVGDQTSVAQRDALVKLLLQDADVGLDWLAAQLPAAREQPTLPRARGVRALVPLFTLGYVRQQRATEITFQGQYAALQRLQPEVGEFLFGLLLDTPDWYPTTHRVHVVAPLRDLQPKLPDAARVEAVERLAGDAAIEPENLRRAVAAMLWQWGHKDQARRIVERLLAATTEGDAEERVQTTLELADFWCQLREYKQSAAAHRSAQVLAKESGVGLKPIAWYAAACVHALLGDVERGLAALEQCTALLASPDLDSSLRLSRAMFDRDPELAALRGQPRWEQALQRAFPPPADGTAGPKR
jgi:hypothetical protein